MKIIQQKPNLDDMLEKIVFEKQNLGKLREAIKKFNSGQLTLTQFREQILLLRIEILEALKSFIPFQIHLVNTNKEVSEFAEGSSTSSKLQQEIHERDELLETIGTRLKKIFENLDSSVM